MKLLEQYKYFLEAAEVASAANGIKSTSIVGSILSYSDSLKNAAYLSMVEGAHLLDQSNLKNILKILITSSLIFNIRLEKQEILSEFEINDNDSFEIDSLFEILGLISYDMFENILEKKEGLDNEHIKYLIKYYFYYNPSIDS